MQLTNTAGPAYFHKVVDCQWACPAHTPVPEYIRPPSRRREAAQATRAKGDSPAQAKAKQQALLRNPGALRRR